MLHTRQIFAGRRTLFLWIGFTIFSWILLWNWLQHDSWRPYSHTHSIFRAVQRTALSSGLDLMFENPDFPTTGCPFAKQDNTPNQCWNETLFSKFRAWSLHAEREHLSRYEALPSQYKPPVRPTSVFDVEVLVITGGNVHRQRADIIMATWGSVWPHIKFVTDSADALLPVEQVMPNAVDRKASQEKWILAMQARFAPGLAAGRRWFLIVDDDAFVVPSNMIRLMRQYDHDSVLLLGHNDWYMDVKRILGGAGWLISAGLARKVAPIADKCVGFKSTKHPEAFWSDVKTVECLHQFTGIMPEHRIEFNELAPSGMSTLNIGVAECVGSTNCYPHAKPFGSGKAVTYHRLVPWQQQLELWRLYLAFSGLAPS